MSRTIFKTLVIFALLSGCSPAGSLDVSAVIDTKQLYGDGYLLSMKVENNTSEAVNYIGGNVECGDPKRSTPWGEIPFYKEIPGGIEPGEKMAVETGVMLAPFQRLQREYPNAKWTIVAADSRFPVQLK